MLRNLNFTALAISGALVYVAVNDMTGNKAVNSALLAVGAVGIASQTPFVKQIIGSPMITA